ncbi:MAG: hypothetical protein V3U52_00320 [Thermoplasmata archaeon]
MLRKALMAAIILLLLLLVLITPRLIGVREDISTLPRLILNYESDEFIIFITSLSGTYVYRTLYLNITSFDLPNTTRSRVANSLGLEGKLYLNETTHFSLEAVAEDQRNVFFDLTLEAVASETQQGWSFTLLDSGQKVLTDGDLSVSPFVTLMPRREAV